MKRKFIEEECVALLRDYLLANGLTVEWLFDRPAYDLPPAMLSECEIDGFRYDDDPDAYCITNLVYSLLYWDVLGLGEAIGEQYRGETMNSFGWTFTKDLKEHLYTGRDAKVEDFQDIGEYTRLSAICFDDNGQIDENICIQLGEYFKISHTLGNFMPLPQHVEGETLNLKRSSAFKDYFDLFLLEIKKYYKDPKAYISKENKTTIEEQINRDATKSPSLETESNYFTKFKGFRDFIDKNFLTMYVDGDYEVIMYSSNDDTEDPHIAKGEDALTFAKEAIKRIKARAKIQAEVLNRIL
ncbi:MAG: hypothetical protein LBN34_04335 [Clostridiales Family XIII bacterium]|jgi:hypothetical protein|nr:hypothetical protein [Clostridiales Family XIII bacterium]